MRRAESLARCNNYQLALRGQGVGLGWTPLIDALVESKALVGLSPAPLKSERGYFVVESEAGPVSEHVGVFKRFLFELR
jgi:hypothetical protein